VSIFVLRLHRALAFAAVLLLPLGWLMLGVFRDREHGELHLFVKHRPSRHFYFSSPVGESDRAFDALSERQRREEALYREYVEEGGGWKRDLPLPWL
jgi:hypothetical protein